MWWYWISYRRFPERSDGIERRYHARNHGTFVYFHVVANIHQCIIVVVSFVVINTYSFKFLCSLIVFCVSPIQLGTMGMLLLLPIPTFARSVRCEYETIVFIFHQSCHQYYFLLNHSQLIIMNLNEYEWFKWLWIFESKVVKLFACVLTILNAHRSKFWIRCVEIRFLFKSCFINLFGIRQRFAVLFCDGVGSCLLPNGIVWTWPSGFLVFWSRPGYACVDQIVLIGAVFPFAVARAMPLSFAYPRCLSLPIG